MTTPKKRKKSPKAKRKRQKSQPKKLEKVENLQMSKESKSEKENSKTSMREKDRRIPTATDRGKWTFFSEFNLLLENNFFDYSVHKNRTIIKFANLDIFSRPIRAVPILLSQLRSRLTNPWWRLPKYKLARIFARRRRRTNRLLKS